LIVEIEESLCEKIVQWKSGFGSQRFEDEYRENEGNVQLCRVTIWWKTKVSSLAVYVRRELAIIQFCATTVRSLSISDVMA